MRILIDTSLLVEGERRNFDLGKWVVAARHEVFICDATVAEYIAGKPLKDAGRIIGTRLFRFWSPCRWITKSAKKLVNCWRTRGAREKPCRWVTACTPP